MIIQGFELPAKYSQIWEKCVPLLKNGRSDDYHHAIETVKLVLDYKGPLQIDPDVLVPVAMMHDIGHSAIDSEHHKYITGPEKLVNGKLVHMLAGAKLAKDILDSVGYDKVKTQEIVDIISIHDADMLTGVDYKSLYDSDNKKIFHDFDRLDRFSAKRWVNLGDRYTKEHMQAVLKESLDTFFFDEFRQAAKQRLEKMGITLGV